eukprot:3246977-Rhodomonas_salina.1
MSGDGRSCVGCSVSTESVSDTGLTRQCVECPGLIECDVRWMLGDDRMRWAGSRVASGNARSEPLDPLLQPWLQSFQVTPSTRVRKPETLNPKPKTRNPKPKT